MKNFQRLPNGGYTFESDKFLHSRTPPTYKSVLPSRPLFLHRKAIVHTLQGDKHPGSLKMGEWVYSCHPGLKWGRLKLSRITRVEKCDYLTSCYRLQTIGKPFYAMADSTILLWSAQSREVVNIEKGDNVQLFATLSAGYSSSTYVFDGHHLCLWNLEFIYSFHRNYSLNRNRYVTYYIKDALQPLSPYTVVEVASKQRLFVLRAKHKFSSSIKDIGFSNREKYFYIVEIDTDDYLAVNNSFFKTKV